MRQTRLVIALLGVMVGVACLSYGLVEEGVTYQNAAFTTVKVMIDDWELATLQPGESRTTQRRENLTPDRVRAFDQAGTLLFDRTYTWEQLKSGGWRVVITDESALPDPGK